MSRLVLAGLLQDMVGSAGSYVYSKWKGIHYLRLKASTVTNPNTAKQASIRTQFSATARGWSSATSEERALWASYAENHGSARNKEKNQGSQSLCTYRGRLFSGMNGKIGSNTCVVAGDTSLSSLNTVPPLYKAPTAMALTYNGFVRITDPQFVVAGSIFPAMPIDGKAHIWFKANEKSAHKYIIATADLAKTDSSFPNVEIVTVRVGHGQDIQEVGWEDKYGDLATGPNVGKVIGHVQFRVVTNDGDIGTASALYPVVYKLP